MHRLLLPSLLAAALLALPAAASAADTLVAPDPAAQQLTALDGTVVWVTGAFGHQRLMQRTPDGVVAPVKGTREARSYRSIDLGHDSDGALRLTYLRCDTTTSCQALWNDLDGRRATFRKLALPNCAVSTAPSWWRTRIAYGLACGGSAANRKRTGLYVKIGSRAPRRLRLPKDAVKFGVNGIESVDLRATRVAAVAADIYEYAFSENVDGSGISSFLAAASEGDSDENARGLALGSGGTLWALTDAEHAGDPKEALIFRLADDCLRHERLTTPPEGDFAATDLAVDGTTLYLLVPGTGVVTHEFAPEAMPSC
ncbi:MAG TPA: hypothetical protein VGO81_05695 [Solirubrobacteraceae bacterium]|nr:hypothetical protein [Solirubrobacteraceae bacterium]